MQKLSPIEINNLNKLVRSIKGKLDKDIFAIQELSYIAGMSLDIFNEFYSGDLTFKDTEELDKHQHLLSEGGLLICLSISELNYLGDLSKLTLKDMMETSYYSDWSLHIIMIDQERLSKKTNICTQCGRKSFYAEPIVNFKCWGCKNGYL